MLHYMTSLRTCLTMRLHNNCLILHLTYSLFIWGTYSIQWILLMTEQWMTPFELCRPLSYRRVSSYADHIITIYCMFLLRSSLFQVNGKGRRNKHKSLLQRLTYILKIHRTNSCTNKSKTHFWGCGMATSKGMKWWNLNRASRKKKCGCEIPMPHSEIMSCHRFSHV